MKSNLRFSCISEKGVKILLVRASPVGNVICQVMSIEMRLGSKGFVAKVGTQESASVKTTWVRPRNMDTLAQLLPDMGIPSVNSLESVKAALGLLP